MPIAALGMRGALHRDFFGGVSFGSHRFPRFLNTFLPFSIDPTCNFLAQFSAPMALGLYWKNTGCVDVLSLTCQAYGPIHGWIDQGKTICTLRLRPGQGQGAGYTGGSVDLISSLI